MRTFSHQRTGHNIPVPEPGEDDVEEHGEHGRSHGVLWLAGSTQHSVQSEEHLLDDIAGEYHLHVFPCVRQRVLAGSEEEEDRIEKRKRDDAEDDAHQKVQRDVDAEDSLCRGIVFLSQFY